MRDAAEQTAIAAKNASELAQRAWETGQKAIYEAEQAILQYTYDMVAELQQKLRDMLKAFVDQAGTIYDQALDAYKQGLQREINTLQSRIDAFTQSTQQLNTAQKNIWEKNVPQDQNYDSLTSEIQHLYKQASTGDTNSANNFSTVIEKWLQASYSSQTDFSAYEKDRLEANKMLDDLSNVFENQVSDAQKQLDIL